MKTTSGSRGARRLAIALALATGLAVAPGASAEEHPHAKKGIKLPAGLQLNGRFDVAYERTGYTSNPQDGVNGLKNYHHFVFLSRRAKTDPIFFTADIVDLSFYEAGAAFHGTDWGASFKAGKILVPFGSDPLFHNKYGGLAGFDNKMLPIIWADFGGAGTFRYKVGPVKLQADGYFVRGYELGAKDDVLRLNADFSDASDFRPAFGGRFSAAWGPATLYYSVLWSPLGFDRNVVVQAVDLTIWRIPGIPVLEDIALMAGFLRADVTGGDAADYYHFGDYLELRYFPVEWLYLQYRAGTQTNDNRKGAWYDERRKDVKDTSAHTLGIWAKWHGMSFGAQHIWRLEKVDEKDDDFMRITVAYEF